jgi:arsenate reductase
MTTVAFVCVRNAGRSQMAAVFAERELEKRDVDIDILTGGTDPAEEVHAVVADVMDEAGYDVSDREPREITADELSDADYVVTMGCSAEDACPATFVGENRDWDLDDPGGASREEARSIRDEVKGRVSELFDEIDG